MITEELLEFLRAEHAEGMSIAEMEQLLIAEGGWTREDIQEALSRAGIIPQKPVQPVAPPAIQVPESPAPVIAPVVAVSEPTSVSSTILPPPVLTQTAPPTPRPVAISVPTDVKALVTAPAPVLPRVAEAGAISAPPPVTSPAPVVPQVSTRTPPVIAAVALEQSAVKEAPPAQAITPAPVQAAKQAQPAVIAPIAPVGAIVPAASPSLAPSLRPIEQAQSTPPVNPPTFTPPISSQASVPVSVPPSTPPVKTRPSDESPVTLHVTRMTPTTPEAGGTPVTPAPLPPAEDFLGLFATEEAPTDDVSLDISTSETLQSVAEKGVPMFASMPTPVPPTGDELALEGETPSMIKVDVPSRPIAESPALDNESLVFGKKPEWSFKDMLAQKKVPAGGASKVFIPSSELAATGADVNPAPQDEKIVRFDLSRLNTSSSSESAATAPLADAVPAKDKQLETKSLAEVWLTGTAKPTEEDAKPYVSTTPRSPVPAKRTMSSDILLRGKGAVLPSMPAVTDDHLPSPALLSPQEAPVPVKIAPLPVKKSTVVTSQTPLSLAEELRKKNKVKEVLVIAVVGAVLLLLVGGGIALALAMRGPSGDNVLKNALVQFANVSSFAYVGDASSDLVLTTNTDGVDRNGNITFTALFSGVLRNSEQGYGDGVHQALLRGGLQAGNYAWSTDVKSDLRVIGNALFFHLLSYPATSDFDPDVMETYWVKVDLAAITKELALEGVSAGATDYGSFSGGKSPSAFATLYAKHEPFVLDDTLPDDVVDGIPVRHVTLKADPDPMLAFGVALYKKYTGSDLMLTDAQALRLKNALAKIVAEVWIDPVSGNILKLTVRGDFDDDMIDAHVKGNVRATFTFKDHEKPVVVLEPTPFLTLEELRARLDDYKKNKDLRVRDAQKTDTLQKILTALSAYYTAQGRFPSALLDLRTSKDLPEATVSTAELKNFVYAPYMTTVNLSRAGRCTARGDCAFYHIGVNFEDVTNPKLRTDADVTSEIIGRDSSGCAGEKNFSCFDVVSTSLSGTPTSEPR
jgi:hypothetical protein